MELTDEKLVEEILNGDDEAYAVLVGRYQRQIYSLTYRLTNNADEAQDLAQEVFLKLYQVLNKYDRERSFFSWMYKVASNHCYTELRKKKETMVPLDNVIEYTSTVPEYEFQPELYLEKEETKEKVQKALADLPEKYRIPLVLRYLQELSYNEIADIMDVPLTTVETRIHRGKKQLLKNLSDKKKK